MITALATVPGFSCEFKGSTLRTPCLHSRSHWLRRLSSPGETISYMNDLDLTFFLTLVCPQSSSIHVESCGNSTSDYKAPKGCGQRPRLCKEAEQFILTLGDPGQVVWAWRTLLPFCGYQESNLSYFQVLQPLSYKQPCESQSLVLLRKSKKG